MNNNESTNREFLNEMKNLSNNCQLPTLGEFKRLAELANHCFDKQRKEHNANKIYKIQIKLLCKTLEEMSESTAGAKSMEDWLDLSYDFAKEFRTSKDEYHSLSNYMINNLY